MYWNDGVCEVIFIYNDLRKLDRVKWLEDDCYLNMCSSASLGQPITTISRHEVINLFAQEISKQHVTRVCAAVCGGRGLRRFGEHC